MRSKKPKKVGVEPGKKKLECRSGGGYVRVWGQNISSCVWKLPAAICWWVCQLTRHSVRKPAVVIGFLGWVG